MLDQPKQITLPQCDAHWETIEIFRSYNPKEGRIHVGFRPCPDEHHIAKKIVGWVEERNPTQDERPLPNLQWCLSGWIAQITLLLVIVPKFFF